MRIIVTAGPTREHLDPVRFLSNPSTGKMGFAIAAEAARRGHDVTLVAGPVSLKTPKGVHRVDVTSAREMLAAVKSAITVPAASSHHSSDRFAAASPVDTRGVVTAGRLASATPRGRGGYDVVFISTAAVADWRPAKCAAKKLKKGEMSPTLRLVRNPDILKTLDRCRKQSMAVGQSKAVGQSNNPNNLNNRTIRLVGFAAETNDVLHEAARKCREKGLSFIVANDVTRKGCGFGTDTNEVTFVFPDGTQRRFPLMTKRRVARRILDEVSRL